MTNTWLCLWAKHIPFFQTRLLSSSAYYFQGRGNIIPADAACLTILPEDDINTIFRSEAILQTGVALENGRSLEGSSNAGGQSSKCDLFSSLCWPLGARNQELINSLRKIVQPVKCVEAIHITKSIESAGGGELDICNKRNEAHNFPGFYSLDEPFNKDLILMQSQDAPIPRKPGSVLKYSSHSNTSDGRDDDRDDRKGPTIAQLEDIRDYYIRIIPRIMAKGERLNENKHDQNIIFENHLRKKTKTTVGLMKYAYELSKIRLWASYWYPSCYLKIRNINIHPQNGYVKIHWYATFQTKSQLMQLFMSFLKKTDDKKLYGQIEAISTIYVNKKGKIVKHSVDRRIRIEDENLSTVKNLAAKTVGMVGLSPNSSCQGDKETVS